MRRVDRHVICLTTYTRKDAWIALIEMDIVVKDDVVMTIDRETAMIIPLFKDLLSDIPDANMIPVNFVSKTTMDNILYYASSNMYFRNYLEYHKSLDKWTCEYFSYMSFDEIVELLVATDSLIYKELYDVTVVWFAKLLDKYCNKSRNGLLTIGEPYIETVHDPFCYLEETDYGSWEVDIYDSISDIKRMEYDEEEKFYDKNKKYDL